MCQLSAVETNGRLALPRHPVASRLATARRHFRLRPAEASSRTGCLKGAYGHRFVSHSCSGFTICFEDGCGCGRNLEVPGRQAYTGAAISGDGRRQYKLDIRSPSHCPSLKHLLHLLPDPTLSPPVLRAPPPLGHWLLLVMFWFGFQPWFWFQKPQTKTKTMESGLVWFGFGLNHGFTQVNYEHWTLDPVESIMNIT
ncbi:hypothetical protein B0H14DRAFT_2639289 [Mycena olivaceomarginata]|nr:hypothetical protein B0H14DRAFT_2639289 [Mycena olivaceomarginata]